MFLAPQLRSMLAPVLLASLSTVAAAMPRDVVAPVAGTWTANSATSVTLRGEAQDGAGAATHSLSAALRGSAEGGLLAGSLQQIRAAPQVLPAIVYELDGAYSRGIDGCLYFSADVRLDLGFLGLPTTVKVGEISGVLQALVLEPKSRGSKPLTSSAEALPTIDVQPLVEPSGSCAGGLEPAAQGVPVSKLPLGRAGLLLATLRFLE